MSALPFCQRRLGQAVEQQQRGDVCQHSADHFERRELVRQHGHGTLEGHQDLCGRRKCRQATFTEVPMGITLREIIFDVAGGIKDGKQYKAVQTGGPMGGCLTAEHLDLPLDYEACWPSRFDDGVGRSQSWNESPAWWILQLFMEFTQAESLWGKCTPCRIGTRRILELLEKICNGKGKAGDIENWKTCVTRSQKIVCVVWDRVRLIRY